MSLKHLAGPEIFPIFRDLLDYCDRLRYSFCVKRKATQDSLPIDSALVGRLLMGALSEHEQRLLAMRLLRCDETFRREIRPHLDAFEMFDTEELDEYAAVLNQAVPIDDERRRLLDSSGQRSGRLDDLLREFTYSDVLSLGEGTRRLFSWSTAERLVERSYRTDVADYVATTSLYLALLVIDVVELLGAAGRSADHGLVAAEVRHRIRVAERALRRRLQGGRAAGPRV